MTDENDFDIDMSDERSISSINDDDNAQRQNQVASSLKNKTISNDEFERNIFNLYSLNQMSSKVILGNFFSILYLYLKEFKYIFCLKIDEQISTRVNQQEPPENNEESNKIISIYSSST